MKQHQLIVILGLFLLSTNSFAAVVSSLVVSGSNDPLVNGIYTYDTVVKGKGSWAKGDYVLSWNDVLMGDSWNITNSSSADVYYYEWSDTALPSEIGWSCWAQAASPCIPPVVTQTPLPETLIVSGAGFSDVNGLYTRTVNSNSHTGLVYEKGAAYFLRAGGFGLMELGYGITNSGGGSYYYVVSDSLVIPTLGWALDFLGTALTPPPVVRPYSHHWWPMFLPAIINGVTPKVRLDFGKK